MTFGFLNHSQVDSKISNFFQKNFWQQILLDSTWNSLYRGKQMLPHVQLSINFRIGWCFAEKYLPYPTVNFAHACLISTALGEPSYYPCKKIFLDSTPTQKMWSGSARRIQIAEKAENFDFYSHCFFTALLCKLSLQLSNGNPVTFKCEGTRPQKCYLIKRRNIMKLCKV